MLSRRLRWLVKIPGLVPMVVLVNWKVVDVVVVVVQRLEAHPETRNGAWFHWQLPGLILLDES